MKSALVVVTLILAAGHVAAGAAARLETPTYFIDITEHCAEGEVGCSEVTYVGTDRKDRRSITLKGSAVMRLCADRVTPCAHAGYEFLDGDLIYRVTQGGELEVSRGTTVLLREQGAWR